MQSLCIASLIILAIIVIWRASTCSKCGRRPGNVVSPGGPVRPLAGRARIEVPNTVIKPPIYGVSVGPMKEVAKSDMSADPEDVPSKGRFAYVGMGGVSCANKRWFDSVYSGGTLTEIDSPGISGRDLIDSDLMVLGNPPDPDARSAFSESRAQKNLRAGEMLV